ncbi:MAG TPA: hypothetical protein VD994_15125, partial [Prosthecobacter sp.]|nr:hypothetical protein [Prosthecobacter sp.]
EGKVFRCRPGSRPFASVLSALREGAEEAAGEEASAENWWQALGAPVKAGPPPVLFVDQFEELFAMVPEMERKRFFSALHEGVKMRWFRLLVAIRSDFADLLARGIRKADPEREGLGQAEYQEIEAFSERRALSVLNQMLEPLYRDHPTLQGQLENFAQAVVEDLLRPPRDRRRSRADEKTLLPVELQTVGMILEQRGPDAFSAAAYHELGGKLGLYRSFLDRAKQQIWRKTLVSEEQALLVLRQLISASRTKIPRSAEEVAKAVGLKERQVEEVLSEYGRMFLVRLLPAEAGTAKAARYDLMHEHLIEILVEAPEPALQKARDAEERLRFWTARATGAWEIPVGGKTRWEQVRDRVATWFRVRLPLTESLRLRKYATKGSEARQIVNLNLRGFAMRGCVLLAVVMLAWSVTWTDAYQIRQLVAETRPEKADRAGEGRYALIWDLALFKAGRIEELKTAARAIQGAGNAWNDYRPEALGLAALGASLVGDTEGVKEMVKRAAADLELEPELKGSNGNREEFTWTTTTNRLVVFCARALKEAGDEKGAKDLLRKFADRFWSNGNIAAGVLPGVVEVLKQCDLAEEVPEILETAVRLIQIEWEGEKSKADLLLAAAGEFARIGNAKRADEVLEQAAAVKETFDVDVLLAATSGFAAVDQRRAAKVLRQYALMAGRDGELNFFKVDPIDPRIRIALTLHGYQDNATAAKVLNTVLKREGPKKVLPNGNEPAKEQDGAGVGTDEGAVEDGISYPFTDSLRSRVALLKAWKVISPSEGWQELEEAVKKELQQVINEAKGRLAGDAGVEEGGDNPAERSARFANAAAGAIEWGREEDGELLLK